MSMKSVHCIEDLRQLARRKVPKAFFEYADGGSYSESTLRANTADLESIRLRQRVMVDVSRRSLETEVLGVTRGAPIILAPVGLTGMQHGDGEILAAQAAEEAGIPYTLSTMSICSIEDVAAATTKPFWFQLYVMRDRGFAKTMLERAQAVKCSALVLTVDLQVLGQRHKDLKNGMTVPPELRLSNLIDIAMKPGWAMGVLRGKRKTFGNIAGHVKGMEDVSSLAEWTNQQFDPALNWDDVAWIKSMWPGKLIIKGINDVEDARIAVGLGADALVVSNHGGRQLDGAIAPIDVLPEIVDAVGDKLAVFIDGGFRRGADIAKALALGAKAVLLGRAPLYGLGAAGEAGAGAVLAILADELDRVLALMGCNSPAELTRQHVRRLR